MLTHVPLRPRVDRDELWVLIVGRVSTPGQPITNIEASYQYAERFLTQLYQGPLHVKHLGEQGSGMLTERVTILEAIDDIASGEWDVCIMEDLSKAFRNPRWQYAFVQDAVDAGTRVILPGDNVDTADENWEVALGAAALRHGLHIPDTRRRVRRTAAFSFYRGGMVQKIRFGYRKLTVDEAASGAFGPPGLRQAKLPEWTPTIRSMREQYMSGTTGSVLSVWLNDNDVPTGPYCKRKRWTGRLVEDLLADPILSGYRRFRQTIYQPIFKTGKHRREKNDQPDIEYFPTLAHLTKDEGLELRAEVAGRRAANANGSGAKRKKVPRKDSFWPGQSAICAICKGPVYYAGKHLRCANSLRQAQNPCWNHVQVPAQLAREKFCTQLIQHLKERPAAREEFLRGLRDVLQQTSRRGTSRASSLVNEIAQIERRAANIAEAIAKGGELPALLTKSQEINEQLQRARKRQLKQSAERHLKPEWLMSPDDVERDLETILPVLARTSYEFGNLLRSFTETFVICPVQALDTPQVSPRATICLRFSPTGDGAIDEQRIQIVLDFFDPPVHIKRLEACLNLKRENPRLSLKKIAARLSIGYMTVKRAFDYSRRMEAAGLSEPYRQLDQRPATASRWHSRRQR